MKKRIFAVIFAVVLAFSAIAGSIVTAYADEPAPPNPNRLPEYTPSGDVKELINVKFALPGAWIGAEGSAMRQTWEKYDKSAGLYWWGSLDNPDDAPAAAGHGWPGWKMKKDASVANLYSSDAPKGTASMIFSNFIDGGMNTTYPEYDAAQQTKDLTMLEYFGEGDSDYFPKEFWDYIYDNYYEDMADDPGFKIEEFGDYADNFFYSEDDDSIFHTINNMIFVVDTVRTERAQLSPVSGKLGLDGAFYFYYGNGEFGIWPTREMCIEKEGLKVDDQGNVLFDQETLQDKTGFVTRKHTDAYKGTPNLDFVVFGNITGKYWEDTTPPPAPTPDPTSQTTTTVPAPNTDDAKSSQSGSTSDSAGGNNSNGSIATGQVPVVAVVFVALIAGLGVVYFVRKRRASK